MTRTPTHAAARRPRLTQPVLLLALMTLAWPGIASAQPSQRPLLVTNTGAKPNIVFSLDNSGSMAFPYPDGYSMRAPGDRFDTKNPSGLRTFLAQRSSTVNSMYYNPAVTYEPRVDVNGTVLADDELRFVSNADSDYTKHTVYAASAASARAGGPVFVSDSHFRRQPALKAADGWVAIQRLSPWSYEHLPVNVAYTKTYLDSNATPPPFTYVICTGVERIEATFYDRLLTGENITAKLPLCTDANPRVVDVKWGSSELIQLPQPNRRTDCGKEGLSGYCSTSKEINNILNWYRYYGNRMEATKTALGLAMRSEKLDGGAARIGYRNFNMGGLDLDDLPLLGTDTKRPQSLRGVRPWVSGPDKDQFYQWLYGTYAADGTPTKKAYRDVADYFLGVSNAVESPWARDPSQKPNASADVQLGNPELSCRRAFQIVLSDGAWNDADLKGKPEVEEDQDNKEGPSFKRAVVKDPANTNFSYSPEGRTTGDDRYVPFPGKATGGLADLAAKYYWHTDLRPDLDNNVPTRLLYPTFWQNLRTYTIGYMIRPSGENGVSGGLTFRQIDAYKNQFLSRASTVTQPSWPKSGVDLSTTGLKEDGSYAFARSESDRIDDFIQSGYTGGGRSFSVTDAKGILDAIQAILADILDGSGNDAGIAMGSKDTADTTSPAGPVKFKVNYRTTDNMGDVLAQIMDEEGNPKQLSTDANGKTHSPPTKTYWSAAQWIGAPAARQLYSIDEDNKGLALTGRLDGLASIQKALRTGPHAAALPDDESFIDYLRGKDPVVDKQGQLYRLRASRIGAIVNSAPLLLGSSQHYGYEGSKSTVTGKESYADFRERIALAPDTLFAATNAGVVHALNAANGQEIAAYMPRRSMKRLLDQAQGDSEFQYVLDGPLSTHDIFDGAAWNELVVGTGGRGERVLYALRPRFNAKGESLMDAADFLWEAGPDTIDNAMDGDGVPIATGYISNPARSGQTDSGAWVVVVNSGHYNGQPDGSRHGLVVLNAMTGKVIRTISLPAGYAAGRGLGGVALVRDTRNRIVAAYAGDAMGQLWRFDLRGDPASWKVSYGKPLFTTENNRPIYAAPAWQAHPKGGLIVVAATGMLLQDSDARDTTQREAIYGIWDPTSRADGAEAPGFEPVKLDQLQLQKEVRLATTAKNKEYYSLSHERVDWKTQKGWKLQLGGWTEDGKRMTRAGERVIEQIANLGSSVVIYSTVINTNNTSEETCQEGAAPGGSKYVLNALDGSGRRAFDTNNDGIQDDVSMVFVSTGGNPRGNVLVNIKAESKMSPAERAERFVATQDGESSYDNTECRGGTASSRGVSDGGDTITLQCPKAWSRQQYQLTRLPQ